jgi:hypothetical protein
LAKWLLAGAEERGLSVDPVAIIRAFKAVRQSHRRRVLRATASSFREARAHKLAYRSVTQVLRPDKCRAQMPVPGADAVDAGHASTSLPGFT